MAGQRWQYKTVKLDMAGWFLRPNIDPARMDEELNAHGASGWELVNVFDINVAHGRSGTLVAVFKRQA